MKCYAILVAGGSGSRMETELPKQFLPLDGLPIMMHTIAAFAQSATSPQIIIVMNKAFNQYWKELCSLHNFDIPHTLKEGGESRFHSVKNGLLSINDENSLVAVHDAVRPLINPLTIDRAFQEAEKHGNAVLGIKSKDSVRRINLDHSIAIPRDEIILVQTPQIFRFKLLKKAYQQPYSKAFTDDASVVESTGVSINLIEGDQQNLKITFPEDLIFAEYLLKKISR
jgi:2-C-methyl-D-erythritol 4-phosphate cytidylyltransferase